MADAKDSKKTTKKEISDKKEVAKKPKAVKEKVPEEILKEKKAEAKAVKKAGPKATRAKKEEAESDKPTDTKATKTRAAVKPARPKLERRGKKYREAYKAIEKGKEYSLSEALDILPKTSYVKFDPSVELHINLGVDPKQADQNVRGTVVLPHSSGQSQRVGVVAALVDHAKAKEAGADVVGEEDLLEQIGKGKIEFDILVATPAVMPKLGRYAKDLGPKGLMPNPKSGTVTNDLAKTVKELKSGRVEFRVDSNGIVHQVIGKLSLKPEELAENVKTLAKAINQAKPASLKSTYMQKVTITTSMGPGIRLNSSQLLS